MSSFGAIHWTFCTISSWQWHSPAEHDFTKMSMHLWNQQWRWHILYWPYPTKTRTHVGPMSAKRRCSGSGIATGVARGAECHPWQLKNCQKSGKNQEKSGKSQEKWGKNQGNREKIRKNREKEEKSGRKGKNREISFTLPLLTDRSGYATVFWCAEQLYYSCKSALMSLPTCDLTGCNVMSTDISRFALP